MGPCATWILSKIGVFNSLIPRPMFCDLLAHAPLSLERNVSLEAGDVVATATSMAGALWQIAAPGTSLQELYRTDPELAHALIDIGHGSPAS